MRYPLPDSEYSVFLDAVRFHYTRTHELLDRLGIYPGQPPLLFILSKHDGLSQRELADKLHIKAATVTIMLKRMEKSGLVERKPDLEDQRIQRVFLSEKGRELDKTAREALRTVEGECFNGFSEEERNIMKSLLLRMSANLAEACKIPYTKGECK